MQKTKKKETATTVLSIPGIWERITDLPRLIAETSEGCYVLNDDLLTNTKTLFTCRLTVQPKSRIVTESFRFQGRRKGDQSISVCCLRKIERHTHIVYLVIETVRRPNWAALRDAAKIVLAVGGIAVRVETTGAAFGEVDLSKGFYMIEQKSILKFLDTSAPDDGRLHSMTGMVGVRGGQRGNYFGLVAKVELEGEYIALPLYKQHLPDWYQSYRRISFDEWWNNIVLKIDEHALSRKDLVLSMANKDGGAHIDIKKPENYTLAKEAKIVLDIRGVKTEFSRNVVCASVAQIGWELLNSI